MLHRNLWLRVAGPTVLVSLMLLASCTAVAIYLHRQEASTAEAFGENVGSRDIARVLETTLRDLRLALELNASEVRRASAQVGALSERVGHLIGAADAAADKPEEKRLVGDLKAAYGDYLARWRGETGQAGATSAESPRATAVIVDERMLPACQELAEFNSRETERSEAAHRATLHWMAAGLAAVGAIGSLAGILLGYGVARGLRRSIYQLSVRVRDAAGKLGQDLPTVTLAEDGDLHHLHEQMQAMIREIEQVVQRLQQREREVVRAEQMAAVGQVAAGVAHELRNPLTSIKMLVQNSRRNSSPDSMTPEKLQIIEQEIRRMERCLQTFLNFARPPRPERRLLDLPALVQGSFTLLEGRARHQQVQLRFRQPDAAVRVEADREQVQQLLLNLTLNALDAMPLGGTLTVELWPPEDGFFDLRVIDTGPGIAAELLPRLFEPFVSSKETGLGLGLVVSRRIAEDHGGTLRAENHPQGGACLVVRLPAAGGGHAAEPDAAQEVRYADSAGHR
jgi:two-component system sensor histidine kinase HydH